MGFPLDQYRRDIHKRGRLARLVVEANAPADDGAPWDGSAGGSSESEQDIIMKFKPVRLQDADGDRVLASDQIVQIFGPDLSIAEPSVGDQVQDGGAVLTIKGVTTKRQGNVTFRYDLHVGR
ncbi:MAG: hypothetical protein ACR2RE_17860 [Geminicoccaceae bacterium]